MPLAAFRTISINARVRAPRKDTHSREARIQFASKCNVSCGISPVNDWAPMCTPVPTGRQISWNAMQLAYLRDVLHTRSQDWHNSTHS